MGASIHRKVRKEKRESYGYLLIVEILQSGSAAPLKAAVLAMYPWVICGTCEEWSTLPKVTERKKMDSHWAGKS